LDRATRSVEGALMRIPDMHASVILHPDVDRALRDGAPVVALESTIISHGMPYPANVETAREVEATVRSSGAVPATIAVLEGLLRVGLSDGELDALGQARGVRKVSRRDLAYVVATGATGATTVAATMICASLVGIRVFVTGGIGGVHRGGQDTLDVSADLTELARTSVAVVCAGAKAILDLPRTLEVLETHGVPVVGYGTSEFPAFYTRTSGLGVDFRLDDPGQVAALMKAKWELGLEGGIVVANPIPAEHAMEAAEIERFIEEALGEADAQGVRGKDVTPFLLARLVEKTGGRSLRANIALVKNNARVGAQIACAYAATAD
jgi:pseudouridine-5'-phosphate glycosidase